MKKKYLIEKDGKMVFKALEGQELESFVKEASAEDLAEYYNLLNEEKRKELESKIEAKASKEDIESLKTEIKTNQVEQLKQLNETLKQHGLAIAKMSKSEIAERNSKSLREQIKENLANNKETLTKMREASKSEAGQLGVSFKAAGDMTIAGNISGGNVPVEQRLPGLDTVASRRIRLLDILPRGTAMSNTISWVSQANKDGAAGGTTEGATKNQIDFDLVVNSETVKKRTAFIKVSTEMLDDIDFMASEINNELMRELLKDVENQSYQGDGTGNNLNGIRTVATAFAAGTFASTIDNANKVDVLTVAMNQIALAEHEPPNFILMHPSDVTSLKMIKVSGTDKRYVDRLVMVGSTMTLDGVPIIATTLVTVDEYLVGNFDMATLWDKGEVNIEVGLDGNDFTKNMRTVIAEWRGLALVKTNVRTAFVKGDFSTDAGVLETP